jgi:hypothetical protein
MKMMGEKVKRSEIERVAVELGKKISTKSGDSAKLAAKASLLSVVAQSPEMSKARQLINLIRSSD